MPPKLSSRAVPASGEDRFVSPVLRLVGTVRIRGIHHKGSPGNGGRLTEERVHILESEPERRRLLTDFHRRALAARLRQWTPELVQAPVF